MKYETGEILVKAACYVMIGFFTPLTTSLAQWANSGEKPSTIVWVVIGATCCVGAATQLLSFVSGSYTSYLNVKKNGSGDTQQFKKNPDGTVSTVQTTITKP